ncbi:PerC family transcriptional regulator [Xenorhabdus griffiniae]|uniref:PerC family transcriptional regulator n=1 Tax=Xenorhabdus griffiniae TaxID=351672 RepID=A0ABY9XFI7_9GAMM|nr:PerC family transcriptional regulator [Xenorhabdus griffiniae]MBD1227705.1 PerC family transcriptional regulator [Xenorhabdus griffiniae]MBE8587026.1 PerC family transcriptional regulator [Xenorhabdus griffiniae]WMV71691.1 PerC family transcriptional regulator [Xenorhabdus griffiniae]WNH01368.1 PerC family transcriptional regulator [Xenorhabdus griffiniae]
MTAYEQVKELARFLEYRSLFRRAAEKWGEALSLSHDKKQEQECIKNNLRCVRKAKIKIQERW